MGSLPDPEQLFQRIIDVAQIPEIPDPVPVAEPRILKVVGDRHIRIEDEVIPLPRSEVFALNALLLNRGVPRSAGELHAMGHRRSLPSFSIALRSLIKKVNRTSDVPLVRQLGKSKNIRYVLTDALQVQAAPGEVYAQNGLPPERKSQLARNEVEEVTLLARRGSAIAAASHAYRDNTKISIGVARMQRSHDGPVSAGPSLLLDENQRLGWLTSRYERPKTTEQLAEVYDKIDAGVAIHEEVASDYSQLSAEQENAIIDMMISYQYMLCANLPLVRKIVSSYEKRSGQLSIEDLFAAGFRGLARSVQGFDITMGWQFSTYASGGIAREISRIIANESRAIRLPVNQHATYNALYIKRIILEEELQRTVTNTELAAAMNLPVEEVELLQAAGPMTLPSLDAPVRSDSTGVFGDFLPGEGDAIEDMLAMEANKLLAAEILAAVKPLGWKKNTSVMQCVLVLRYGIDATALHGVRIEVNGNIVSIEEIVAEARKRYGVDAELTTIQVAELLGRNPASVRELHGKALESIRENLGSIPT